MTNDELDRLADAIARALARAAPGTVATWVPAPVRPAPPEPPGSPPVWSGAGQDLGDIAPVRNPTPSGHRDDVRAATRAIRAAAAGHGVIRPATGRQAQRDEAPRSPGRGGRIEVPIGVSNRHVHLSEGDARTLFGPAGLTSERPLTQPGQFAAAQRVALVGPRGRLEGVRVVGPARGATQVELALSDAAQLGVTPVIANSGRLEQSVGGVTLEGPAGRVVLARGVIVAARHLHCSPDDARRWRLADGDVVTLRAGTGSRAATWHGVLVRTGPGHATEFHLDVDEARACQAGTGDIAVLVAATSGSSRRRRLVTERDVLAAAATGEALPPDALLTPSARDRARALGLLPG